MDCIAWLKLTFAKCADYMPDKDELHLPERVKKRIYKQYVNEMARHKVTDVVSRAHFYRVWREHLPYAKTRKYKTCARCDDCDEYNEALQQETNPGNAA